MSLNALAEEIHELAVQKGFYDKPATFVEKLYLIASEVFEAGDAFIKHNEQEVPEELADILIRLLDFWRYYVGGDIDDIVRQKIEKNKTRPPMHGKKL